MSDGKVPVQLGADGFPESLEAESLSYITKLVDSAFRYYGRRKSHNIYVIPDFFARKEIKDIMQICNRVAQASSGLSETLFYR